HVFGLVALAEQQLRDTVDDAAVSQDRELEPKARYAAVLGFPIGFGRRAFADLQSGHHAVPIEPPTLIRTRPTPEGYSFRRTSRRMRRGEQTRRPDAEAHAS